MKTFDSCSTVITYSVNEVLCELPVPVCVTDITDVSSATEALVHRDSIYRMFAIGRVEVIRILSMELIKLNIVIFIII